MFEGVVAGLLNRLLGKYVQDLDTENLNVGIFSGSVCLTDLKLKPEALFELDLPIDVKIGTIGRISLQIPWAGLYSQPVIVNVEDVLLLVGPAISNTHYDPEREKRLLRAAKRHVLTCIEEEGEILSGPQDILESLYTAIVNNLQIYVRNVHVRYEDSISSKDGPLACGLCLQSLSIETTNSKWKPSVSGPGSSPVYQLVRVESLSLYWNPIATVLDDKETAHITPMQYYNWKHYMITGLDKFSMHREVFEFLLKPVTCKVKVIINRSSEARVPKLLVDAVVHDSSVHLSRRQYLSIDNLMTSFSRISLNRKYRHLHPGVPLTSNVRKWWRYAYACVLEQRVRPYTWAYVKRHRDNYRRYKATYMSVLNSPNDTELKLDLQQCQDNLPIMAVVIARECAKIQLLSKEPDRVELHESEAEWWRPSTDPGADAGTTVELLVKSERCKSLWSHLSSPEKKKVCELIGYVEGVRPEKPRQYIEHKINLTLGNSSLTLTNKNKEIMVTTLTQFLVSIETRPSAKAYKVSCRAECIVIEGNNSTTGLCPLLTAERQGPSNTPTTLLAVDLEKNPIHCEADYGVQVQLEPFQFDYNENAIQELVNFFQTNPWRQASADCRRHLQAGRRLVTRAVTSRKLHLNIDVRGVGLVVPERQIAAKYLILFAKLKLMQHCMLVHGKNNGCMNFSFAERPGRLMILDISRVHLKSDLQPSNLALEDATCMELEERLYDRLHAECTCQLLFCDPSDPWRETRKNADSDLHLVPRTKITCVFSNSIKKDYKLLPRYKLNLSITSLSLNLSDRIITQLLDYSENLPIPIPNTVPVSSQDSQDFPLELVLDDDDDEEVVRWSDKVAPDPGLKELVKLRRTIVAAYLSRNRMREYSFDPEAAKLALQQSEPAFHSAEHSDEDMEVYARSVDQPGFDDNVSPANTIGTLMRFIVGEIVLNLARSTEAHTRPYLTAGVYKCCLDYASMSYGPAVQLSVASATLAHKHQQTPPLLSTADSDIATLLYRKVRADCPDFRTHFHSVEQSLVLDIGDATFDLNSGALQTLFKYLQYIVDKVQHRRVTCLRQLGRECFDVWERSLKADPAPPVPPGATKFSYSIRVSSITTRLSHSDSPVLTAKVSGIESEFVFRANDRMLLKLYLATLHVDDSPTGTLYPALIWPDEDKVLEIKLVRAAPRFYGRQEEDVKANGELRLYVGRLHIVVFYSVLQRLQQFLEPLVPNAAAYEAMQMLELELERRIESINTWSARLNLVIEIHAPVLLLPQKPSSPTLLVINLGDLTIENFFKKLMMERKPSSPLQHPVIDNVLVKLANVTLSRAVMTLQGTLQLQEPILEPISVRCDMKRCVSYQQAATLDRELLLLDADVIVDPISANCGQQDLAALFHVWCDNFGEGQYIGSIVPSSPVEMQPSDIAVKKLQEFFAQGEPIRKECVVRVTLEGFELKLFTDMDEILSSPVRDLNHGLAKISAGEAILLLDSFSDKTSELKASLQSLLIEDIRPMAHPSCKTILSGRGSGDSAGHVRVRRPALAELSARRRGAARCLDVRVDRCRLQLPPAFLIALVRALLDTVPGDRTLCDGAGSGVGVVNHGYVGEMEARRRPARPTRPSRPPSGSDTSGYYSTTASVAEDAPSLSVSIQFRQPEVLFFTEMSKGEGHALMLKSEVLIDYSSHSNTENLVVSLAGLQMVSKLRSQLKSLPPQVVLKPCDLEYSKSYKSGEEGIKVNLSVSDIDIHLAAATVHTVTDIADEISAELWMPEEKDLFVLTQHAPAPRDRVDEDLWAPRKLQPHSPTTTTTSLHHLDYTTHSYSGVSINELINVNIPNVSLLFDLQYETPMPVLMIKLSASLSLSSWSTGASGVAWARTRIDNYNQLRDSWEPLLEPVQFNATIVQARAYPMTAKLDANQTVPVEYEVSPSDLQKKSKKRRGFESETSADECDTDNEMTFIQNPNAVEHKGYNGELAGHMTFLNTLDGDESDSENESGLMDKLANAIGHLFTDESSGEENDESSAAEQSEVGITSDRDDDNKAVSFMDADGRTGKREMEHKTVTLQEPMREDSVDSGLETEAFIEKMCTYIIIDSSTGVSFTLSGNACSVLKSIHEAFTDKNRVATPCDDNRHRVVNYIGPGSTIHLISRKETDLAGNDRIVAVADYDADNSRPSTPGEDTSPAEMLDEAPAMVVPEIVAESEDEWDCGPSPSVSPAHAPPVPPTPPREPLSAALLYDKVTELRLCVRAHDLADLTVLCPVRSQQALHVLPPSKNGVRYHIVVERDPLARKTIIVRSPLQLRNDTSYPIEIYYRRSELPAGEPQPAPGSVRNPFDSTLRLATVPPDRVYSVPLYVAYHCHLYVLPAHFESYQLSTQGIWWKELSNEVGTPRDIICRAKDEADSKIFAMRIVTNEGVQSPKATRSIPNYLIRVLPPLIMYNRLPYAVQVSVPGLDYKIRIEAGERTTTYHVNLLLTHRVSVEINYMGLVWSGSFNLSADITNKSINMSSECETDGGNKQVRLWARLDRGPTWHLHLHAPYWLINKTGLPLQLKATRSDTIHDITDEPLLWSRRGRPRLRLRAHHSLWSRAFTPLAGAPGLVAAHHRQRGLHYRMLLNVTLSELCPQLTKIVTILPYFLVHNETKRHLRFMEENEAADLWMDLAPQQTLAFWPQTTSMSMHCKFRDSTVVSQHFPINRHHSTVLRMDKGSAILVEVVGGTDTPFTISFKWPAAGDVPVRVDNLCDDLFLKLHQIDSGQVALLSPYQSMLYTWDDPAKERTLIWNIYNNKGKGFLADFTQDGYGEEKVSFQSVKHTTLMATNSVTSKLSSTFKRLTPKTPSPNTSSSDDSDSSDLPENHTKSKKMRKDKVIVFWVSYMEGYQRVFVLAQDERIAYQYRMRINAEKSNYEVYLSLPSISLSVCVQTNVGVKELAYVSVTDSLPRWEVNVSHKWKELSPDLTAWIEDNYQNDQKKCQLKEYIHMDLEKMQMTKPFFSELRRTYNPGIWLQLRKSDTHTFCHFKMHRLQIDNQLNDAVFPCVLYPAPLPPHLKKLANKPSVEICSLKQHRAELNQDIYKHFKVLIQEHCVNLDRGFVNYIFDIMNHWNIEEKPAVRLRADLALVHMPLPIIALKNQNYSQKDVVFEYLHLSPIKIVLSLSSRGYSAETSASPTRTKYGMKKENRPKLFNSDLLEYLFNSWGSSLCDMKDVDIRMSYLELRNAPLPMSHVLSMASRHYWPQLVQHLYVLVLGLRILGNPYSLPHCGDVSAFYYDPCMGTAVPPQASSTLSQVYWGAGASAARDALLKDTAVFKRTGQPEMMEEDVPESLIEVSKTHPASVALALSGLIARPTFDEDALFVRHICRSVARCSLGRPLTSRACLDRRIVARRRLPRHCVPFEGIRPYSLHSAVGQQLFLQLGRGHFADSECYLAHAPLPPAYSNTLLVSTQHIFMVRAGSNNSWHIEWAVKLDDLIGVPNIEGNKLIINIKQDEQINYYSSDEKVVEVCDPEVLNWVQAKIECALILAMEDKRCPAQL